MVSVPSRQIVTVSNPIDSVCAGANRQCTQARPFVVGVGIARGRPGRCSSAAQGNLGRRDPLLAADRVEEVDSAVLLEDVRIADLPDTSLDVAGR